MAYKVTQPNCWAPGLTISYACGGVTRFLRSEAASTGDSARYLMQRCIGRPLTQLSIGCRLEHAEWVASALLPSAGSAVWRALPAMRIASG